MDPFKINRHNETLEVIIKITNSMVNEYGCQLTYDKQSGTVDLVGEQYCYTVVEEVVNNDMRMQAAA